VHFLHLGYIRSFKRVVAVLVYEIVFGERITGAIDSFPDGFGTLTAGFSLALHQQCSK